MMVYSDHGDGDQGATHWTRHHMTNYRCIGDSEQTYRKVLGRMETKERGVMEEKVYHSIKNETLHGNSFDYKSFDSKKDEQIQRNKGERSTRNIDNEKTTAVDLKTQKLVPQSEYNDPTGYLSVDLPEEKYKKFTSENKCQDSSLSVSDFPEERLKKSLPFDVKSPEYFYVNSPPVDSLKFRNSVSDEDDEQLFKKVTKDVMNKFNSMQMEWSVSGKKSSKLDIDNTLLYMYAGDGKVELPPLSDECSDQETRNSDDLATDSSGCVTVAGSLTKHLESRIDVTSDRREESAFRCDEEAVLVSFINSDEVRVQIQDVLAIDGKVAEEKQSCKPEYALSPPDDINSIRPVITDGNIVTSVSPGIDKKDNRLKVNSNSAESSSSLSSHVNKPGSDGAKNIEKVENKSSGNSENGRSHTGGQGLGNSSKNGRSHTGDQGLGDGRKNGRSHTGGQGLGDGRKNGRSHTEGQGLGDESENGRSHTRGQGFGDDSKNGRSHPGGQGLSDDSKNGWSHPGGQGLGDDSKNGWSHPGGQGLGDDSKNGRSHTGDQGLGDGSKNGRSHTGDCSRPPEDGSGDGSIEEKSTDRDKDGINKRSQDQSNRKDDHEADVGAASNAASHRRRDEMKLDFKTPKKKVSYTSNTDEIPPKPPDGAVNHRVSGSAVQPFLAASAGQNDIQHGDLGQYDVLRAVGMLGSNYGTEEGVFVHEQFSRCLVFCLLPGQPVQGAEAPCRVCDVFLPLLTHSSQCLSTLTLCLTCKAVMAVINFHVQHCGMVGETPAATSKDVHSDCPLELCRKMKNKLRQKTIDKVMKLERIWMNTQRHLRQVLAKVKTRRTRPASYSIDDITAAFSVERSLYEGHASLHVQPSPLEAATSQSVLTGRSGGNLLSFDNLTSAPIDSTTSVSYRSFDVIEICSSLGGLKLPSVVEEQIQPEEARAPSVLESTRSLRSAAKGIRGQGEVAYGERRHLLAIAQTWTELKYSSEVGQSDREEGIILVDDLVIKMGRYRKGVEWQRSTFLGSGMSGKCHLAIDNTNTNVRFCRKKIKLQQYEENELTVWSNLTHPCIVRLYGAVRLRNKIYIFSELMEGGSLANVIGSAPFGQLNSWLALQYFQQLLYVLAYLEEKRVIHEDLKTDNILVRAENIRLAVSDFGLACVLPDNQQCTPPDLSPVGGQAQYSPEKASSKGHDFGSDLWAAVCDFVEMLSGYAPWTQRFKQAKLLHYLIYQNSPPLEDIPAGLPDAIYNLIITGWTVDSTQRPSASTLLQHRAFHLLEQNPADPMFTGHIVERDYVEPEGLYSSELEKELESIRRFLDIEAVNNTTAAEADADSAILDRTRHQQSLNTDLIEDMERLMSLPRDIPRNMVTTSNVSSMLSESLVATSNVTNMSAAGFSEEMCAASQVNKKRSESMNTVKTNKRDKERNVVKPPSPLDLEEMQNKLFQELATPEPILDYEDHELSYNTVMVDNEDKKFASEKATSPNNKNQEPATEAVMSHVKNTKSTSWTVTSEATPMTVDDGGDLDRYGSLDIYSSGVNEEDLNDYLKGNKTNLSLTTPAVVIPNLSIFNTSIEDDTDAGQGDSDVHTQSTRSSEDKLTMTTSDGHESVTLLTSHLEPIEHDELSMTNWSGGTTSRPTVTGIHRIQLERTRDNHPRSLFLSPSGEFSHVTHLPSEENTMGNFQNIQQNAENQPVQPLRADFELSSAIPHSPENAVQPKSTPVLPTSQRPEIHKSFSFQGSSLKQRRRTSEIDQELAQLQSEFAQDCLQSAHFDVDHQDALLNEIAGVEDEIPAQLDLLIDDDDLFTSPSHMHQSMDSYSSQHQHEDDIVINFFGTNSEVLARFRTSYRNTQWEEIILGVSSQIHEGGYDVFVVQDMAGDQLDLDGMVTTSQDVFVVRANHASHEWWVRDKQVGMPGMDF